MKISEILKNKGYKNNTYRICEFLGFDDTDQLKGAKFFSQEESYSSIPIIGWGMSNGDCTWRVCETVDDDYQLYSIDEGYKITLKICEGYGSGAHRYYQCDFLSLLKSGHIIPYTDDSYIKHIRWEEPLTSYMNIVYEADVIVKK